jgi:hypothetical protein
MLLARGVNRVEIARLALLDLAPETGRWVIFA